MKFGNDVKKLLLALTVVLAGLICVPDAVKADSQLTAETEVYYANSKIYHLKGECGTLSTSSHMPLKDALGKNMKMCEACAKDAGIDSSKAKQLSTRDLPLKVSTSLTAPAASDSDEDDGFSEVLTAKNTLKNAEKSVATGNSKNTAKTTSKATSKNSATAKSSDKSATKNSDKVVATKSNDSEVEEDVEEDIELEEDDEDFEAETDTGSKKSSAATSKKSSGAVSSKSTSSDSASGKGELMSEAQRRKKFYSSTNPKRGVKPVSTVRPASMGFLYADFGTFNSYASENGLGMTPVYLLGTVKEIEKASDKGDYYGAVLMVNDCDGYQWYMRLTVAKDKYDLFKKEYLGKTANIYGYYTGYSGVTRRPMMDPTVIIDEKGAAVNMSAYK